MTTSSDVIAGLELALASADAMIERLTGERAILRDSAKDVIAWCDKTGSGNACTALIGCAMRLRQPSPLTQKVKGGRNERLRKYNGGNFARPFD